MEHLFGTLLTQYRKRKPGISQAKLARLVGYDAALLARMCHGQHDLTGPSGRRRILRIINVLCDERLIDTLGEANALLAAAELPPLYAALPAESALIKRLQPPALTGGLNPIRFEHRHLPAPLTSFIGREVEIEKVISRFQRERLLTLTGVGGCGKTRMAIELGNRLAPQFADGVCWIELAPLHEPELVPITVAQSLGIHGVVNEAAEAAMDSLVRYLRPLQILLILDNCEQLLDMCARCIEQLLLGCLSLKIITTSREALGMTGELRWSVAPLSLPAEYSNSQLSLDQVLSQSESVRLFYERALDANQVFELTDRNIRSVVDICRKLDGLPLAIELAAAEMRVLSVEQLASLTSNHYDLLTKGSRTAPQRHQTLVAMIDWSYRQLRPIERRLFRFMGVFVGGCELEQVESLARVFVIDVSREDIISATHNLVGKNLIGTHLIPNEGVRYTMLELMRKYAHRKMHEHDEWSRIQHEHVLLFLSLATAHEPHWTIQHADRRGLDHQGLRLDREQDNMRAALLWCKDNDVSLGLELAGRAWTYWWINNADEGIRWLTQLTELAHSEASPAILGRALLGLGNLYLRINEIAKTSAKIEQALSLLRSAADHAGVAIGLCTLAAVALNLESALQKLEEALDLLHQQDSPLAKDWALIMGQRIVERWQHLSADIDVDPYSLRVVERLGDVEKDRFAVTFLDLGYVAMYQNDLSRSVAFAQQGLHINQAKDDEVTIALFTLLGESFQLLGDTQLAEVALNRAYLMSEQRGLAWEKSIARALLGRVSRDQGNLDAACRYFQTVLEEHPEFTPAIFALEGLACVAVRIGQIHLAVKIFGSVAAYRKSIGNVAWKKDEIDLKQFLDDARSHIGNQDFVAAWADGSSMSLSDAVEMGLSLTTSH